MSVPPPPPRRRAAPEAGSAPPAPPRPNLEARAARRAEEQATSQKRWWLSVIGGLLGVAIVAVVAIVAFGGGGDKKKDGPTFEASTAVDLKVGNLDIVSPSGQGAFPPELAEELIGVIGKYVDEGIVAPLREGKATDPELQKVFDLGAINRLTADRAVLLDEELPEAVGKIDITAPPVNMLALASGPKIILVTTAVDLSVEAETETGTVTVHRTGTLVFAQAQGGEWRITGWTLHVDRGGPGVPTTTTLAPATTVPAPTTTVAPG
jgi:hypothetical protein